MSADAERIKNLSSLPGVSLFVPPHNRKRKGPTMQLPDGSAFSPPQHRVGTFPGPFLLCRSGFPLFVHRTLAIMSLGFTSPLRSSGLCFIFRTVVVHSTSSQFILLASLTLPMPSCGRVESASWRPHFSEAPLSTRWKFSVSKAGTKS